jgi:hypothetical protein
MWVPVHDEEWDGDFPLALERPPTPEQDCDGHVVFKGDALPWQVGQYEVSCQFSCLPADSEAASQVPLSSRWQIQCYELGRPHGGLW